MTLESKGLLAKINEDAEKEIQKDKEIKERQRQSTRIADMSYLAKSLNDYYANNRYNGD